MCQTDEPNKPQKPLTNLQIWSLDDEDMPEVDPTDDQLLEETLIDDLDDEFYVEDDE